MLAVVLGPTCSEVPILPAVCGESIRPLFQRSESAADKGAVQTDGMQWQTIGATSIQGSANPALLWRGGSRQQG